MSTLQEIEAQLHRQIVKLEQLEQDKTQALTLENVKLLPTQKKYFDAVNEDGISVIVETAANQTGKTFSLACDIISEARGKQPWDGRERTRTPYDIALLLPDYDNHGRRFYFQDLVPKLPPGSIRMEKTPTGAPRLIKIEGGKNIHVFSHDQDTRRLEGGKWQAVFCDEPPPKAHVTALWRGLQQTGGKLRMVMTPLDEPWIYDELYSQAGNLGGPLSYVKALTAFPDENLRSEGGYLEDDAVAEFRASLSEEEREARVHGRWMHLIGRVYKEFQEDVHVVDLELVQDPFQNCPWGLVIDPHDRRPFAMSWFYVTPTNDIVFRYEFPTDNFAKMKSSPYRYQHYISAIIDGPPLSWVIIDPNKGRCTDTETGLILSEKIAESIGQGLIDDVADRLVDGHHAVKDRLNYDRSMPLGWGNKPSLFIWHECKNHIQGMNNYTWDEWTGKTQLGRSAKPTPKEEYKDFPDLVRYACMCTDVRYFDPEALMKQRSLPRRRTHRLRPTVELLRRGR